MGRVGAEDAMQTVTLEEAQSHLAEIIDRLGPGDEVVVTRDDRPVARIRSERPAGPTPVPGRCRGMLTVVTEDDEHLRDFSEYMP
jgi:antitoxin (DNA-binding transcriptional repressor) of toxin-antitoxin stability system